MFSKFANPGSERIVTYPNPKWDEYTDGKGVLHRQTGGRFWDELQIKPRGAGDYINHAIFNAYQKNFESIEIENAAGEKITVKKYPTPNLLAANDAEMLSEFICWTENFTQYENSFRPEIILMNFYGLQNWTNAHFHLYAGARQSQFWTVLDDLLRVRDSGWLGLYERNLSCTRLSGTRNDAKTIESILAINITDAARVDGVWNYAKLRQVIESLTIEFQLGLTPGQRRAPAEAGFGGYGSLVFLPDGEQAAGRAYYLIGEILNP